MVRTSNEMPAKNDGQQSEQSELSKKSSLPRFLLTKKFFPAKEKRRKHREFEFHPAEKQGSGKAET